jgi:prolyl 4-hydroxylase
MSQPTSSSELLLAAQQDAAGRHDDAINALARGTRAGNLTCMTLLGKRLLVGDRAPLLAAEGARFLQDAALQGDAEAAARMAALAALGLYCRQNWQDAVNWLTAAAERNWRPAQEQLLALAELTATTDSAHASREDWARLAGSIDFTRWQSRAAHRDLSADPQVRALEAFISPAVCEWLIARSRGCLTRARVYDPANRRDVIGSTRTNSVANFNLAQIELVDVLLQARMSDACGVPIRNMEAPAVLHYALGEEATDHFDFVDPDTPGYAEEIARNGQRVVTFLIYLNDDYLGGETSFPVLGFGHRGRRGDGLLFVNAYTDMRPDLRMLHAGRAPTRGEKWIVSQFIRSRATLVPIPLRTVY